MDERERLRKAWRERFIARHRKSDDLEDRRPTNTTRTPGSVYEIAWDGVVGQGRSPPVYGQPEWDDFFGWDYFPRRFESTTEKQRTTGPMPPGSGFRDNLGSYAYGFPNSVLQGLTPKTETGEGTTPDSVKTHYWRPKDERRVWGVPANEIGPTPAMRYPGGYFDENWIYPGSFLEGLLRLAPADRKAR